MKIFKRILLVLVIIIAIAVVYNYPKLNILAGYSAKNMASSVFVAERSLEFTDIHDNNFSPINLASDKINESEKSASASAFGLLTRKAFYREGLGSVLVLTDEDLNKKYLAPKRSKPDNITPYPYGNASQKDTIFTNVDYLKVKKTIDKLFDSINKLELLWLFIKIRLLQNVMQKVLIKTQKF